MSHFINDKEKMADFVKLTKEEFLSSYAYLTEDDYYDTFEIVRATERLDYFREQIEKEQISTSEIVELQSLSKYIDPSDTLLLEWAGVDEQTKDLPIFEVKIIVDGLEPMTLKGYRLRSIEDAKALEEYLFQALFDCDLIGATFD